MVEPQEAPLTNNVEHSDNTCIQVS